MTLRLSHSQQLLDSQSRAYANLLCWRPSNLFPFNRQRGRVRKKHYQNVERDFFFLTHPRFVLGRPHSMPRFSAFLTYTQLLFASLKVPLLYSFLRVFASLPRSLLLWSILLSLSCSPSVSTSNSNSNSHCFIGMTRESLAWAHSPCLALHKAARPGPVTSGLAWSTGCVMLRRGSWALCVGSDLWTATLWACQRRVRVRDSSDRVSLFGLTQTTTVLWSRGSSARGCEMSMSQYVCI